MMRAGVDAGFQRAAADAVVDELRHARLCAAVVEALGGEARAPLPDLDEVPRHEDVDVLEALLRNVLAVSCLNETVAVALLESNRRLVTESTLRRVLTEILSDEVGHSRLGWQMLSSLAPRIDDGMRARLGAYLVPAFAQLFERHTRASARLAPAAAEALGVEDRRDSTGAVHRRGQRGDPAAAGGVRPAGAAGHRSRARAAARRRPHLARRPTSRSRPLGLRADRGSL